MTVARDIMTPDPQCVKEDQTLVDAARHACATSMSAPCRSAATTTA